MLLVNEGPFVADHPSGELIGPSAPLEPKAGCEEWFAVGAEAAAAELEESTGELAAADELEDRDGE